MENSPDPVWNRSWFQAGLAATITVLLLYVTLLLQPLRILSLTTRPAVVDEMGKVFPGGGLLTAVARYILLPLLVRHPRVLDGWIREHASALSRGYEDSVTIAAGRIPPFYSLPFDSSQQDQSFQPTPGALAHLLRGSRRCLAILGQGGAGKTRLAIELGRWLFAGELTTFPAAALFIDEDFVDMRAITQDKLRALLPKAPIPPEFVDGLLSKGRLWLIVDRLSERQESTRAAFTALYRKVSPETVVFTARYRIDVDVCAAHRVARPAPKRDDSSRILG